MGFSGTTSSRATFPSGWTLTGEVGKMMPISKQCVAKIDDDAAVLAVPRIRVQ